MTTANFVFSSVPVKSVDKAIEELQNRKEKCFDQDIELPGEIYITDDGEHINIPSLFDDTPLELSPTAKANLANIIGIAPGTLWEKFSGPRDLDLRIASLRRFIPDTFANTNKKLFGRFRTEKSETGDDKIVVRALLSELYSPLDDLDVFVHVMNALSETGLVELRDMESFEEAMYARFLLPDHELEINGKACIAGLRLSNSEVGHSATHIVPTVVFSNGTGLTFPNESAQVHQVHKGKNITPQETLERVCAGIPKVIESLTTYMYALQEFEQYEVVDPELLFDILEKDFRANKERISKKIWKGARMAFNELSTGLLGTGKITGINILEAIASAPLYVDVPFSEVLYLEELCAKLVTGYGSKKLTLLTILK